MTAVLVKRGNLDRDRHTGRSLYEYKSREEVMLLQAQEHQRLLANQQKPGERPKTDSLRALRKRPTSLRPCSWTSDLQDSKTIRFCCLSFPICGTSLQQPQKTNTQPSGDLPSISPSHTQLPDPIQLSSRSAPRIQLLPSFHGLCRCAGKLVLCKPHVRTR